MSAHPQSIEHFSNASKKDRLASISNSLKCLWSRLEYWLDKRYQRRMLSQLDDHMLKDIGISRAEVIRESQRPFWQ